MKSFDIGIIGSGPGGYVAAIRASQLGASVALVEYRELGGCCLNRGCIPTKAMLHCAHVFKLAKQAADFGVKCADPTVDMPGVHEYKDAVVTRLRGGVEGLMKKHKVTVLPGKGRLTGAHEIVVAGDAAQEAIQCKKIILATGSESRTLPDLPYDGKTVLASDDLLTIDAVPRSLLVVGAGAIGCEWANMFANFGTAVTIVELLDHVLPGLDADVSKEMFKVFKKAKMSIHTKTKVESLEVTPAGVKAALSNGKVVEADKALIAVGRSLCSSELGLEACGVETERGAIQINDNCQTSVPSVYAIGDVTGRYLLAHVASRQGIVAAEHAMGHEATMDYDVVPNCIYTEPEVAGVGLTEAQANEQGIEVHVSKFHYQASGKAQAIAAASGFVKLIGDAKYGEILGAHIVGPRASDVITEVSVAMKLEATVAELASTIHPHPTLAEGIMESAEAWYGRAIHG